MFNINSTGVAIGIARSVLALGTLFTLLFNDAEVLFPLANVHQNQPLPFFAAMNLFHLLDGNLFLAKMCAIAVLISVLIGFLPKITGILHWWVSFSFFYFSPVINGGDQITTILTLFLIPICVLDRRKNHWQSAEMNKNIYAEITIKAVLLLIAVQMSVLYFVTVVSKLFSPEWINGTALFYWFSHNLYGATDFWRPFIVYLVSLPFLSEFLTWGTLVLELLLSIAIFMCEKWKTKMFYFGLILHLFIGVFFGLVTFFLAMTGGLILYLICGRKRSNLFQ